MNHKAVSGCCIVAGLVLFCIALSIISKRRRHHRHRHRRTVLKDKGEGEEITIVDVINGQATGMHFLLLKSKYCGWCGKLMQDIAIIEEGTKNAGTQLWIAEYTNADDKDVFEVAVDLVRERGQQLGFPCILLIEDGEIVEILFGYSSDHKNRYGKFFQ